MSFSLRPYQSAAIQGIYNYFQDESGNPLVVIPTAGGKSLVMATFVEGVLKAFPDQRILIVTHVRELIEQNFAELKKLWPQAPAGIYSAGLKKREIRAQILFAGIQSIHRRLAEVGHCDLVLIEGYKREPHLKIEVRASFEAEPLAPGDPAIVAIASDVRPFALASRKRPSKTSATITAAAS